MEWEKTCRVGVSCYIGGINKKNNTKRIGKMTKGYSFMNYYCVRRLLEMGACESDFVQCFADVDDTMYLYPLNCLVGGRCDVMFLGYGRRY